MNKRNFKKIESISENDLIAKAAAGDRAAFDVIVERHGKMVFNICYKFLGSYEDAEDCAQEVFLKAYRGLGNFAFRSSFTTWLFRISINTCKNYKTSLQTRKKNQEIPLVRRDGDTENTAEIKDGSFMPEVDVCRNEQYEQIMDAVRKLPADLKAVVMLRDVENLSYEEVSVATGFKIGTVKSKLSRARHHLREELRGML